MGPWVPPFSKPLWVLRRPDVGVRAQLREQPRAWGSGVWGFGGLGAGGLEGWQARRASWRGTGSPWDGEPRANGGWQWAHRPCGTPGEGTQLKPRWTRGSARPGPHPHHPGFPSCPASACPPPPVPPPRSLPPAPHAQRAVLRQVQPVLGRAGWLPALSASLHLKARNLAQPRPPCLPPSRSPRAFAQNRSGSQSLPPTHTLTYRHT